MIYDPETGEPIEFTLADATIEKLGKALRVANPDIKPKEISLIQTKVMEVILNPLKEAFHARSIENQKPLRDLLNAFKALGHNGQATFLYRLFKESGYLESDRWDKAPREEFIEAATHFLTIPSEGRGRHSEKVVQVRGLLFHTMWKYFIDIGINPTTARTGLFSSFMTTLIDDPAMRKNGMHVADIHPFILKAKNNKVK